jgi:muramoyltetrapeptide carboxypeptidase
MKSPDLLRAGDTIGVISPSHIAGETDYRHITKTIESLGFRVKLGSNIFKDTHGYLASEQERASDLNDMAADSSVKMILFGGGWGASEILPLIDYENISRCPKFFSSFSDGTSILNAIYAKTGLITYYGLRAGDFRDLSYHGYTQFSAHFTQGRTAAPQKWNGSWRALRPGACEGTLVGGYAVNFALLPGREFFPYDPERKYILFLEDNVKFGRIAKVSVFLSHIEQSKFIEKVGALIFA